MSLVLLFHYLLLNMFRMLVHSSSGSCDLLWTYFICCIALVRCVFVLRCGMQAEAQLQPAYGYHTTPAEQQRNTNTHRNRAIQHMK